MWVHETQRVYGDRLLEEKDFDTLSKLHTDVVKKVFEVSWVGCRAECGACCGCEASCGCVGRGVRRRMGRSVAQGVGAKFGEA